MTPNERLVSWFPRLRNSSFEKTSIRSALYNCIAWSVGEDDRKWWPDAQSQYYWPPGAPREVSIDAFVLAFQTLGYQVCDDRREELEAGFEKVALYALGVTPKHAAIQLASGAWSSKLGPDEDIQHSLDALTGARYGIVVRILRRPRDHH